MNSNKLLGVIKAYGDRQVDLADAIGISRVSLSAKIHERNGATFTQPEILKIKQRYSLSCDEIDAIFFNDCVSQKDTNN